jgi:hypothetical protein
MNNIPNLDSIDKAFRTLVGYKFGHSHEIITAAEKVVKAATSTGNGTRDVAEQLVWLLNPESINIRPDSSGTGTLVWVSTAKSTFDCKQFACKQLAIVGGPDEVSAIAPLLLDADTADIARYALEPMDNEEAGKALLNALDDAPPSARAGIINSLGRRGSERAVGAIARCIDDADPVVASAAIHALGAIGGNKAVKRLSASSKSVAAEMRRPVEDALLLCAYDYLDDGENRGAAEIFDSLFEDSDYERVQIAALRGMLKADSEQGWILAVRAVEADSAPSLTIAAKALLQELID